MKDLAEIPDNVKNRLDIHPVKWIDQVLEMALERKPEPLARAAGSRGDSADFGAAAVNDGASRRAAARVKR